MLVYDGRLLDFDADDLSATEQTFLIDSVPLRMRPAELRKHYWESEESGSSSSCHSWIEVRPSGYLLQVLRLHQTQKV